MPGVILALAYISFVAWFDNTIIHYFELQSVKKIFIGSILGLVIAYFVRFYSLSCNGIKSSYEKINTTLDETAYLSGYSKLKTFLNIHVPYLKSSIFFVTILISLEIIRELPKTYQSPTMAPFCKDEEKYDLVEEMIKKFKHIKEQKIKIELNNERSNAIKGFKDDVESGDYPNSNHTVDMLPGEKEALLEKLNNF